MVDIDEFEGLGTGTYGLGRMPTSAEILELATDLYMMSASKGKGHYTPNLPELEELKEEGFLRAAQIQLMKSAKTYAKEQLEQATSQTIEYLQNFIIDIDDAVKDLSKGKSIKTSPELEEERKNTLLEFIQAKEKELKTEIREKEKDYGRRYITKYKKKLLKKLCKMQSLDELEELCTKEKISAEIKPELHDEFKALKVECEKPPPPPKKLYKARPKVKAFLKGIKRGTFVTLNNTIYRVGHIEETGINLINATTDSLERYIHYNDPELDLISKTPKSDIKKAKKALEAHKLLTAPLERGLTTAAEKKLLKPYEIFTGKELKEYCKGVHVKNYSRYKTKEELINFLANYTEHSAERIAAFFGKKLDEEVKALINISKDAPKIDTARPRKRESTYERIKRLDDVYDVSKQTYDKIVRKYKGQVELETLKNIIFELKQHIDVGATDKEIEKILKDFEKETKVVTSILLEKPKPKKKNPSIPKPKTPAKKRKKRKPKSEDKQAVKVDIELDLF